MKVNKRIGKFKQWTGEKLGGQQKTELSEDFQSLEQEVELRKAGIEKMYNVSKEFSKYMTRKYEAEGTDTGKVLPIDGLGLVLSNHGDDFGSDSTFGQALTSYGKAQQQIAVATANFTDHMDSGWLTSLEKLLAQVSEYTNQRKKLDSRRLSYDAMLAKVQKSKKEKRELEDDLRVAKNRYEETSAEVQERAIGIQESEADQIISLTRLLAIQSTWVDEQKKILDDLKRNWPDPSAFSNSLVAGRKKTAHAFGGGEPPSAKIWSKSPISTVDAQLHVTHLEDEQDEDFRMDHQSDNDDYQEPEENPSSRRQPRPAITTHAKPHRPYTQPESLVTKEKTLPNISQGRHGGVKLMGMPPAGSSSKQSDGMASSENKFRRSDGGLKHQSSSPNLKRPVSSSTANQIKWMKAKWAYNTTEDDELEFEVGHRIKVINEINSEWLVGRNESTGQSGMFPAAYCIPETSDPPKHLIRDAHDTFADPDEHDTEDGEASDKSEEHGHPASSTHRQVGEVSSNAPTRSVSYPGKPPAALPPSSYTSSTVGKRAPPPPPTRRATTASAKPVMHSTAEGDEDQPEAFGSVSELKKRLGMCK